MPKQGLKSLVQNSVGTLIRQLGAGVLQLVTVIVIARALGPEGNGQFAIALLLPTTLYRFLEVGLPTANAHFLGSQQVSAQTAFKTSLRWFRWLMPIGMGLGILAIWLAGNQWFPGIPAVALWLALSTYPVLLLQTFLTSLFQGLQDFKSYNLVLLSHPAISLVLSLLLVWAEVRTAAAFVGANLVGAVLTLLFSYWVLRQHFDHNKAATGEIAEAVAVSQDSAGPSARRQFTVKAYSRTIVQYALKSHVSIALAFLNYRVDVYLLNLLGNTADTGIYAIATQMVEKLWMISSAVTVVMLPLISQMASEEDKRRKITPLLYLWVSLFTSIAGLFTALIAPLFVPGLFGSSYEPAVVIIQMLLPGIIAWSGARILAQDLTARGKPELNVYMNSGVLLINVVGNLLLIPRYGMWGAAIATTVAYCLFAVQMLFFYSKIAHTNWRSAFSDSLKFSKRQLKLLSR